MTLELSTDEAQALINLIDAAVRAGGLQAALIGLPLARKIQDAAQPKEPE